MESAAVTLDTPLIAKDVPEGSGSQHLYHFILVTPGRDYTLACNTPGQRTAWMVLLMKGIEKANKDYMYSCLFKNGIQLLAFRKCTGNNTEELFWDWNNDMQLINCLTD